MNLRFGPGLNREFGTGRIGSTNLYKRTKEYLGLRRKKLGLGRLKLGLGRSKLGLASLRIE